MKSLEIVNSWTLDVHEKRLKLVSCGGSKEDIVLSSQIDKLLRIRQDLVVLEIIRKKRVDMKLFVMFCVALTNEEILFSYNSNCSYEDEKLTMEELLKLKQWLERGNVR